MGAPKVIAAPTKSYVAINGFKCDKSISPTLCDLGRVSNLAAAVTLPRPSNFGNRNNGAQGVRSLPHKKRPISEVWISSNSTSLSETVATEASASNVIVPHKKRKYTLENQSSTSASTPPSTTITNSKSDHVPKPQVKRMQFNLTKTPNSQSLQVVSSTDTSTFNSVYSPQNVQRNPNSLSLPSSQPSKLDHQVLLQPVPSHAQDLHQDQLYQSHPHLQRNHHGVLHPSDSTHLPIQAYSHPQRNQNEQLKISNTIQSPNQYSTHLPIPVVEQHQTQHLLPMQLFQQNQQLRNENTQLKKQLSLFRQLMKNPQRLNQVLSKLEQQAQ